MKKIYPNGARIYKFLVISLLLGLISGSCTKNIEEPPVTTRKGKMQVHSSANQEGDFVVLNDCSGLQGFFSEPTSGGYAHALTIRGSITEAGITKGILLILFYNQEQDIQSGIIHASLTGNGTAPFFVGTVNYVDPSNPAAFKAYSSLLMTGEPDGTVTITGYDQANGFISGNFSFKGQENTGGIPGTNVSQISGSFTDVIVFPSQTQADQCYAGGGSGGAIATHEFHEFSKFPRLWRV